VIVDALEISDVKAPMTMADLAEAIRIVVKAPSARFTGMVEGALNRAGLLRFREGTAPKERT
jgi:hypothetical protein